MAKPLLVFLFGSEPEPVFVERAEAIWERGKYDVKFVYWERGSRNITIPFKTAMPRENFVALKVGDPRGGLVRRLVLTLWFTFKFRRAIGRRLPRVVYAINLNMCAVASLGLIDKPSVAVVHEFQDHYGFKLSRLKRWLYKLSTRRVKLTIMQSHGSFEYIRMNGLEAQSEPWFYFPPMPRNWEYKHKPRLEGDVLTVSYIGYIRGAEIVTNLLEVTRELREEGLQIELRFSGTGPDVELVERASEEFEYVHFSGPFEYSSEYEGLLSRGDVIFAVYPQSNPSFRYHIARRFTEGVLAGLPLIVCKESYMGELVRKHGYGWAVPEEGRAELKELLRGLAEDRSRLEVGEGVAKLREEFTFANHVEGYLGALERLI